MLYMYNTVCPYVQLHRGALGEFGNERHREQRRAAARERAGRRAGGPYTSIQYTLYTSLIRTSM